VFHRRVSLAFVLGFIFLCAALVLIVGVVFTHGLHSTITCPKCDGKGEVWEMWYDFDAGTWIQGYRTCRTCDGTGRFWLYTASHSTFLVFFSSIFVFLGFFGLSYAVESIILDSNPWIRDVKEMGRWFNWMYSTWIFHKNRKTWVKWTTAFCFVGSILLVVEIGLIFYSSSYVITRMPLEVFWSGCIFGIASATLFVIGLYPILWGRQLLKL
jgi:hypothetical protein